ncbi:MAG: hypothetical protein KatS3mg110_0236 [Pirellulaceae bacterium]|nr:MAG: hypothetical protein KatS3mg110_0236 [Pirellulaceae bacterium]
MQALGAVLLEEMAAGQTGRVVQLGGEPQMVRRLEEMGLRVGTYLRVVRAGSPCIIHIDGHRLSLRGSAELAVWVALDGAPG